MTSNQIDTPEPSLHEEMLTYAEAAAFLNVSINTLYWWVHIKKLRHVRHSKRMVRFRLSDLKKWNDEHAVEPRGDE